jgi:putative flippase GtrA
MTMDASAVVTPPPQVGVSEAPVGAEGPNGVAAVAGVAGVAERVQRLVTGAPRGLLAQFVRYVFVGGAAFVADFGTLALLKESGLLDVLWAAAAAFMVGTAVNYAISTRWVFTQRSLQSRRAEFAVFTALGLVGLGLNLALMWVLTGPLRVHYLLAKGASAALVLVWNFSARKWALFRG